MKPIPAIDVYAMDTTIKYAWHLYNGGEPHAAQEVCRKGLKQDENNVVLLYITALCFRRRAIWVARATLDEGDRRHKAILPMLSYAKKALDKAKVLDTNNIIRGLDAIYSLSEYLALRDDQENPIIGEDR